jgi:glyoxylate/hydroxypyruvate reductase
MGGGTFCVDAVFLDTLPSLHCVVGMGAGIDHIDLDACARRGVAVANAGRIDSVDVADHAVGMLIDVLCFIRSTSLVTLYVRQKYMYIFLYFWC